MEMNIVLRTMLRAVTLLPTNARDERFRFNGVTNRPAKGGLAAIRRRDRADGPTGGEAGVRVRLDALPS
jgi:hypothetical protein